MDFCYLEDWDEEAPKKIKDEKATIPSDWREDLVSTGVKSGKRVTIKSKAIIHFIHSIIFILFILAPLGRPGAEINFIDFGILILIARVNNLL